MIDKETQTALQLGEWAAKQAPYVRYEDVKQEDDPLFYADKVMDYAGTLLAGIGIGATIVALCV